MNDKYKHLMGCNCYVCNQEKAAYMAKATNTNMATYQFSNLELLYIRAALEHAIKHAHADSVLVNRSETNINTINQILAARNSRG